MSTPLNPATARTHEDFVLRLMALKGELSYTRLKAKTGISASNLQEVLAGKRLLEQTTDPENFVERMARALTQDPEPWVEAYRALAESDPWGGLLRRSVEEYCLARWLRGLLDSEHACSLDVRGERRIEEVARRVQDISGDPCTAQKLRSWLKAAGTPPWSVVEAIVQIGTPDGERPFQRRTHAQLMWKNASPTNASPPRKRTVWPSSGGEQLAALYDDLIKSQVANADLANQITAGNATIERLQTTLDTERASLVKQADELSAQRQAAIEERDRALADKDQAQKTLDEVLRAFHQRGGSTAGLADPADASRTALKDAGRATAELSSRRANVESDMGGVRERLMTLPPSGRGPHAWSIALLLVTIAAIVIVIVRRDDDSPPALPGVTDLSRPFSLASLDGRTRLSVEANAEYAGASAVLVPSAAPAVLQLLSPNHDNADYRHLRIAGTRPVMCLGGIGSRSAVGQAHCDSTPDLYWKSHNAANGTLQFVNMDGKCLTRLPGDHLEQLVCDSDRADQRWLVRPSHLPGSPARKPAAPGDPKPEEFALGGRDKPCQPQPEDIAVVKDVTWPTWREVNPDTIPASQWEKVLDVEPDHKRQVHIEMGAMISADLYRANHKVQGGREETFYWARAWGPKFTPDRVQLHLQWTPVDGPGGWHTCSTTLDKTTTTLALPRQPGGRGRKIAFRVCVTYWPETAEPAQSIKTDDPGRQTECSLPRY